LYDYHLEKRLPGGYIDYLNQKEIIGENIKDSRSIFEKSFFTAII